MPRAYTRKSPEELRLTAADFAWRDKLELLVHHYEAVRNTRGPEHDRAERALSEALQRHQGPFLLDNWIWQWSASEQSILRHRATGIKGNTA